MPLLGSPANDVLVGLLARLPRLAALGGDAPLALRMAPAGPAPLAASHRMGDGVHGRPAHGRADAPPAVPSGLADRYVLVVQVAHLPDGVWTLERHLANLTRGQGDD